jgi:hypothetical protein
LGFVKAILALGIFFLLAYEVQEKTILWKKNQKLSWTDFKGIPQNSQAAAVTASGLTYSFSTIKKNNVIVDINFEVSSFFYPYKSWYQPALCDSLILSHEQLHFDITEVYAEKFRVRLAAAAFTNNAKAEVKAIYDQVTRELNKYQNLYDAETNFSRDLEQQLLWNKKIAAIFNN